MRMFFSLVALVQVLVSSAAFGADGASVQTVDSAGEPSGNALVLDDVRCRYDGKKLSLVTGGEKAVQFLVSIDDFQLLPATREWKGTITGTATGAFFQDAPVGEVLGLRYRASDRTRCDIALERTDDETRFDVKCTNLVDADTVRTGLQHVLAKKLACKNAKLAAR